MNNRILIWKAHLALVLPVSCGLGGGLGGSGEEAGTSFNGHVLQEAES